MDKVPTTPPASLHEATNHLSAAMSALGEWHARQTDVAAGRTYVSAGHVCIDAINATLRELHTARSALVGELRDDEDQRAVRVDLLLAEIRADRVQAGFIAVDTVDERLAAPAGGPLPQGVDGWTPGGAR